MNLQKQHYVNEAKRFYEEHNRSPRMLDWTINNTEYPNQNDVVNVFGSWRKFLDEADLPQNKVYKTKSILCEICGLEFKTTRKDRKICDSKRCRYIRDSILHTRYLKKKYKCSMFHFVPDDKLVDYLSCMYDVKMKNLPSMKVI